MLIKDLHSPLTRNNTLKLLLNGEEKFPELISAILFSILQAIYLAKKEILTTIPYLIPGDNIIYALRKATLGVSY